MWPFLLIAGAVGIYLYTKESSGTKQKGSSGGCSLTDQQVAEALDRIASSNPDIVKKIDDIKTKSGGIPNKSDMLAIAALIRSLGTKDGNDVADCTEAAAHKLYG